MSYSILINTFFNNELWKYSRQEFYPPHQDKTDTNWPGAVLGTAWSKGDRYGMADAKLDLACIGCRYRVDALTWSARWLDGVLRGARSRNGARGPRRGRQGAERGCFAHACERAGHGTTSGAICILASTRIGRLLLMRMSGDARPLRAPHSPLAREAACLRGLWGGT